jgi:penicillin amidase
VFQPYLAQLPRIAFALEHLLTTSLLPGIDRRELVRTALEEVGEQLAAAEGPPATWGDTHRLFAWQALPDRSGSDAQGSGDQGPDDWSDSNTWPGPGLSGDHDCVMSTSSVPGLTDISARGSAARFVWDLADRDNSHWVVPLGASGIPGHPHHRDQLDSWRHGRLLPVITDFARLGPTRTPSSYTVPAPRRADHDTN